MSRENSSSRRSNCAGVKEVLLLLGFGLGRLGRSWECAALGPENQKLMLLIELQWEISNTHLQAS